VNGVGLGLVLTLAALISAGVIMALLPVLRRYVLAHPNGRSSHGQATPQGAGVAVIFATVLIAAAAIASGLREPLFEAGWLWPIFAAALFIMAVGFVDDIWTIDIVPRLIMQTLAVGFVIASLPLDLRVIPILPWWAERAILLLAFLWFVNLTNFMDGVDWMTVVEFVPMAIGLVLLGWLDALPLHGVVVAIALCGALIGFAPFNRPVARIFLGDVGSLPIGLLFGWLLLLLAGRGHVAAALILPLYYLADATITLFRRMANGEAFWQAHRTHFYQRATDRGWRVPEIVGHVFGVNAVLVGFAVMSVLWPSTLMAIVALGGSAIVVAWLLTRFSRGQPAMRS
jgi:UDP-N-acetylmuramyl pentapeptide phosphotransferase/UDP-N-acetylglucosamine-1-phosphate transferase